MSYQMLVKNLFNDMYLFFSGGEAIGLQRLADDYQGEPLLTAFLSNLDQALEIPYMDAMQGSYAITKNTVARYSQILIGMRQFQKFAHTWKNGRMNGVKESFWLF